MTLLLPKSLYARLMLLVLMILVSTIVTYSWYTSERQSELLTKTMIEHETIMAVNVSESCAHYLVLSDYAGLDVVVQKTVQLPDIRRIQVCEKNGTVVSDAFHGPRAEAFTAPPVSLLKVPSLPRTSVEMENKDQLVIWQPISAGGLLGWLKTTYSMSSVTEMQAIVWRNTAMLGVAWIAISFGLFFFALRSPLHAIRQLTDFARRLNESKGEQVSVRHGSLEIEQLEGSLNYASLKLSATEQQLISEQERLAVTLQSIGDGVIAVNRESAITLINKVAEQLTGCTSWEAVGKPLTQVFRVKDERNRDQLPDLLRRAHDGITSAELPARAVLIARDNTERSIANSAAPIIDGAGNFIGIVLVFRDVTEHDRALDEIARLAAIVEYSDDAIIGKTLDGVIVSWNTGAEKTYGYSAIEAKGRSISLLMPSEQSAELSRILDTIRSGRSIERYETRRIRKDGEAIYVSLTVSPIKDASGKVIGASTIARDITERKKAEAALQRSENNYRTLMEQSADGISIADRAGNYIDVNDRTLEMLGYTREELLNLNMNDIIVQEDLAATPLRYGELRGGQTVVSERRMLRKDGATFPAEITGKMLLDGRLYGVVRDITERRHAEEALRESENRYKHLIESVTDYIVTVTLEQGRPVSTVHGPGCIAVTGYRPEDYRRDADLWYRMIHQDDRSVVLGQIDKIIAGARSVPPMEHRITHRDGSIRWVKNAPVPRYDAQGALVTYDCLISDITERKKVEDQLRQAQKMEAIGQLAGGVAHDFNNILTAIMGYGHILHMKMKEDDPLRMSVEHLLESVDRAAHLTHSLLAFSRKQIIALANVELTDIIKRVEKFLRRIIGEDIELRTAYCPQALMIYADSGQIEQVLMNLATNARDAMPQGGRFMIETGRREFSSADIQSHGIAEPGAYAVITITDTGMGMDAATQKRIFDPFFTTKEVGRGTGLGLAMVYGIIKQHHGYINVYSEPGSGATFRIYFPLVGTDKEQRSMPGSRAWQDVCGGTETLLLAEDDDTLRDLEKHILEGYGYTVIDAKDGEEAIDLYVKNKENIRLLLLDMIMPRKSGKDAYDAISRICPGVKTVFVSGYTADKIYTDGLITPGTELLLKPLTPRALAKKVRDILDGTTSNPPPAP